jgi:hypothetical protein
LRSYVGAKRSDESGDLQPFSCFSGHQQHFGANVYVDCNNYFLDNRWILPVDGDRHFRQRHEYN